LAATSVYSPTSIKTKAGTFTNRLPQARWSPGNGDVADKSAN
jgi:hypothetical protein